MLTLPISAPLLLAACTPEAPIASDYELTLVPSFLDSQLGLTEVSAEVKVRLVEPDAEPQILYAGVAVAGETLAIPELPPVPADTVVGLIFEAPGGSTDAWNRAATLAYGEATVTEALATGGTAVELPIEVLRVDTVGRLGTLRGSERRQDGAVGLGPDGSLYVFGGGDPDSIRSFDVTGVGTVFITNSDAVTKFPKLDLGYGEPIGVATLPEFTAPLGQAGTPQTITDTARASGVVTYVESRDQSLLLVTGGRYSYAFSAYNIDQWVLFDPATDTIVDTGAFEIGRSSHLAIPVGNKVLLYGGLTGVGAGGIADYELWSTVQRTSEYGHHQLDVASGSLNAMGTTLGEVGVVCGGLASDASSDPDFYQWIPQVACHQFNANDTIDDLAPLPIPLACGAIAPLPDGGLLVAGGITDTLADVGLTDVADAIDRAFRWDPSTDAWTEVGSLATARAHHRMVPLDDGRVLVVGGMDQGTSLFGGIDGTVRCAEVFDPATDTFTETTCSDAGQGQDPRIGAWPGRGYAVLEGTAYSEGVVTSAGATYGVVGGSPVE
ncbi:MAG: kelch repeat-containing protein [Myxococcota bacterium]